MIGAAETLNIHHPSVEEVLSKIASVKEGPVHEYKNIKDATIDYVGVVTRRNYFTLKTFEAPYEFRNDSGNMNGITSPLSFGSEYFELLDLIDSVRHAKGQFVMLELGAGYGRWSVKANAIVKLLNPMPVHFTAVEAEPSHFKWLQEHFKDNGLEPKKHTLLEAAITDKSGLSRFYIGTPSTWYGQALDRRPISIVVKDKTRNLLSAFLRKKPPENYDIKLVKTITLNSILKDLPTVDLIDLDIQGEELKVLSHSIDLLNQKVKRLHIATHSIEVERGLLELFEANGWKNTNLYPCLTENETPYGKMRFVDGVQSWLNPKYY